MHLKRLIVIKVLLQCRLASCNCSTNSQKETYNKLTYQKRCTFHSSDLWSFQSAETLWLG